MRSQGGFTLIEASMVISVVFILSVVVLLSTRSHDALRLNAAAHHLVTDIRYAQECAVTQRIKHGLYFSPSGNSYYIYQQNTGTKAINPLTGQSYDMDYDTSNELGGVDLVSTNFGYQLEFNAIGEPYNASSALSSQGSISLGYGGSTCTVRIEAETGKAFVQ